MRFRSRPFPTDPEPHRGWRYECRRWSSRGWFRGYHGKFSVFTHYAIGPDGQIERPEFDFGLPIQRLDFMRWVDCGRPRASLFDRPFLKGWEIFRMAGVLNQLDALGSPPETCAMLWKLARDLY